MTSPFEWFGFENPSSLHAVAEQVGARAPGRRP